MTEREPIESAFVAHEVAWQYGPFRLPIVDTTYTNEDDLGLISAEHDWARHDPRPVEGTPAALDGQHNTYAGVNIALLRRAGHRQVRTMLARAAAVTGVLIAAITAGLAAGPLTGSQSGWVGAALVSGCYLLWSIKPNFLGRILGWFEPDPTTCLRKDLAVIPLDLLPARAVLSRTLWNLGLGKRLAHLTPAAHEVMVALAEESDKDLQQLAEMAEEVTTP